MLEEQHTLEGFRSKLDIFKNDGVDDKQPVKFRYCESMLNRALSQKVSVQALLLEKIQQAFEELENAFKHDSGLGVLKTSEPINKHASGRQHLQELVGSLDAESVLFEGKVQKEGIEQALLEQDMQLLIDTAFVDDAVSEESGKEEQPVPGYRPPSDASMKELTSIKLFKESIGKVTIDKRVSKAIKDGPENPGPLNPESLAIRSLTIMRDLSPHYLNRYVSYIDTLLWLQQVESKLKPAKKGARKKR